MFEELDKRCEAEGRLTINRLNDDGVVLLCKALNVIFGDDEEEAYRLEEAKNEFKEMANKVVIPTLR